MQCNTKMPHWTEIGSTTTASGTFLTDVYRNEETGLKDLLDKFFKTKKSLIKSC